MKIRERCTCGAEFEIQARPHKGSWFQLEKWRQEHRCDRLIDGPKVGYEGPVTA